MVSTTVLAADSRTLELKNFDKRDTLIENEKRVQVQWRSQKLFEVDAPGFDEFDYNTDPEVLHRDRDKSMLSIAYPYMNGSLHAGHAFTLSKAEFTAGFARMQGKRSLFPLGFHCTGMPIKTCADKLAREIELFGKDFSGYKGEDPAEKKEPAPPAQAAAPKEDVTKFSAKKGKAASKAVAVKYQFQIMQSIGVPTEDIHKFADPYYWLEYFPPLCEEHCNSIGLRIDWRRSMLTTDVNPYYDAFVRWQMNRLKDLGKIKFGERYTVYSPKDGQPCMDHDRSDGEGVGPQEYTGIKLKVLEWTDEAKKQLEGKIPAGADVYLVAATLRPETMYGQTCCFVGPKLDYGLYQVNDKEVFLSGERAIRNMAFQGIFPERGVYKSIAELKGQALIGTLVNAPLSVHTSGVRVLPMETVLATKGTGVVTSVPSDSPDDFATVTDLAKKADYYGIKKEWAELEIIPIIDTPNYGNKIAETLVKQMKINSPKDAKQLAEAKEIAYKEGFYQGTMLIGDFKGEKVEKAKPQVRESLIKAGLAFAYSEPERKVTSRSGDDCVVALCDQWYLDYGEAEWRKQTEEWVEHGLNSYAPETKHGFEANLAWLNQWACARSFGLGSKLPWDPQYLVESLSDSTVYHSYYTIAHLLHSSIDGKVVGPAGIKAEQMIDEVWDFVFHRIEFSQELVDKSGISEEWLRRMRREFEYFYPLDINISGKDLIQNHLTFFLYVHCALFPKRFWPRGVRANGHLLLNGDKMAKSTGNFLTLNDMVKKYGADASRIALADAGDSVEDANFEESVANAAILRLYTLREWCEDVAKQAEAGKLRTGPVTEFWDRAFANEMNQLIEETRTQYEGTYYKAALKAGFYDFQNARDSYREATAEIGMHKDLILKWISRQALMISVIAPHWAEYVWQDVLKNTTSVQNERFPTPDAAFDTSLTKALTYIRTIAGRVASTEGAVMAKLKKNKAQSFDPSKPKRLTIFVALTYPAWQDKYITLVKSLYNAETNTIDEKALKPAVAKLGEMKKAMPFIQQLRTRLIVEKEKADEVFDRKLGFDELASLREVLPTLIRQTGCKEIKIVRVEEGGKEGVVISNEDGSEGEKVSGLSGASEQAVPGVPGFAFENI